jgi:hypothetical protein
MLNIIKLKYHEMMLNYNLKLYEGCLNDTLKQEIFSKIDSHQTRIFSLNNRKV